MVPVPMPETVPAEIVEHDLQLINNSKVMLVHGVHPSWGSAMEVYHFAQVLRRPVVTFVPQGRTNVSAWLRHYSTVMETDWSAALHAAELLYKAPD